MRCKMWESEGGKYWLIEIAIGVVCAGACGISCHHLLSRYELYQFLSIPVGAGMVGCGLARLIIFGFLGKG